MLYTSEKYASKSEIEIFTFGRGYQTRISRSSVQKRRFHQSMIRPFWQSDFFNRICRFLPIVVTNDAGKIQFKWAGKSVQLPQLQSDRF
ncbi:hypothetical protein C1X64_19825 [Pseudomonas sp. GW456-E7]|nr:hypothetical protein C1X64_19825 [Pseudomonas sp. GW456-E7]